MAQIFTETCHRGHPVIEITVDGPRIGGRFSASCKTPFFSGFRYSSESAQAAAQLAGNAGKKMWCEAHCQTRCFMCPTGGNPASGMIIDQE